MAAAIGLTAAGGLVTAALAGPAGAATSGQSAKATMKYWSGHVDKDSDGDTEWITISGSGEGSQKVRNAGIQAMEHGQCHAGSAAARMTDLTVGKSAALSAPTTVKSSLGRPVRTVTVGGVDVQKVMLDEGYVLFLNLTGETTNGYEYRYAMEKAATEHQNLWDSAWCGSGPQQKIAPKMWINYDGDGSDDHLKSKHPEYVRIYNPTSSTLHLKGWWLRDATLDPFVKFKKGASIKAHSTMFVYVRKGHDTKHTYYMQRTHAIFTNPKSQTGDVGDGAFLFDPDGDLRAHADYPCVYHCTKPSLSLTKVSYNASGSDDKNVNGEYVTVKNTGSSTVNMWRVVLTTGNGKIYRFGFGNRLGAGDSMTLHMGKGHNTAHTKHYGSKTPFLTNSGGTVSLRTTEAVPITCKSWGSGHC